MNQEPEKLYDQDPSHPWLPGPQPDLTQCRATPVGTPALTDCLVPRRPLNCIYALSFGGGFFCLHPERHKIEARTRSQC